MITKAIMTLARYVLVMHVMCIVYTCIVTLVLLHYGWRGGGAQVGAYAEIRSGKTYLTGKHEL